MGTAYYSALRRITSSPGLPMQLISAFTAKAKEASRALGDGRKAARLIFYVQYTSPAHLPPLEHSAEIFMERGCDVTFFGLRVAGDASALIFPQALQARCTFWQARSPGILQKLHYLAFVCAAVIRVARTRVTWVYCSDALTAPIGLIVGRLGLARVLFHEHDNPSQDSTSQTPFNRLLLSCRACLLRKADCIVYPNAGRAKAAGVESSALTVWNVPRARDARHERASGETVQPLRLLYHGSIVPDRVPISLITALGRLRGRCRLSIVGYFTESSKHYATQLLAEAAKHGVESLVTLHGTIPTRDELLGFGRQCDVGLSLVPIEPKDLNFCTMAGASNKPFDYLASGLALLVTRRPEWELMYVATGLARSCDPQDVDSIVTQLTWFDEHRAEVRAMGELGRHKILGEWNYEQQFEPVARRLIAEG